MGTPELHRLFTTLTKSGATLSRTPSTVMPASQFVKWMHKWPDNMHLSITDLRMNDMLHGSHCHVFKAFGYRPRGVYFNLQTSLHLIKGMLYSWMMEQ